MTGGPMWVAAGALKGPEGLWLMHRRPLEKHHGGLWEFPGGKVEDAEAPVETLIRELREELDIACHPANCVPLAFAEERDTLAHKPIVILLYTITAWDGTPKALEGGRIGWFTPQQISGLDMPPLDRELAPALCEKG